MKMQQQNRRNYALISPTAKSLLLLKGLTNIPFAKAAAELISLPEKYNPDINNKDLVFWKRVVHFESRYWSIDQLLSQLTITNILELSSGFSFRGLDMVTQKNVNYIDTDLKDVIAQKQVMITSLQETVINIKGSLKMASVNALDEKQVNGIVNSFPGGPVLIINEGLLMYLNNDEKKVLCKIIHKILKQRGGFWITGDIYIRSTLDRLSKEPDDQLKEIVEQQRIEDNMFESFNAAEDFFKRAGFIVDEEAVVDYEKLSSLRYLLANATETELKQMQSHLKIQATWRLAVKKDL